MGMKTLNFVGIKQKIDFVQTSVTASERSVTNTSFCVLIDSQSKLTDITEKERYFVLLNQKVLITI
jgi:3,4-dihydroxy-2-butanone 4-phosphate synthase